MKIIYALMPFFLFAPAHAQAPKKFTTLWEEFYKKSHHQSAAKLELHSHELAYKRASRHWFPRAYIGAQWSNTNDPTQVFFGNLGQRAVLQSDFVPDTLNNPERSWQGLATLGIDLPLYEGGMKEEQKFMYQTMVQASRLEGQAKKTEEYSELGRHYGLVLLYWKDFQKLAELRKGVEKIVSNYQVGAQSNPVGHSGLLGLKGVDNRIKGAMAEMETKMQHSKGWISAKIESQEDWRPDSDERLQDFLQENLSKNSGADLSSMLSAQELKVQSLENMKNMEKARHLPRIGLFAQNNLYNGSRDTESSQAIGLYFSWELFNSDSYGRVDEAQAKALSGRAKIEAGKREEKIILEQLAKSKVTLEKNLHLLEDSEGLLREQASNAMRLFRSGMLTALQLAEVINRRVDLIEDKNKAEASYLDVYTRLYQLNN